MKALSRLLIGIAVLGLAEAARADFRADPPKPPVKKDDGSVPLVVQIDPKATQGKLEIPRKLLGQAKADLGIETPAVASHTRLHTIAAGLSLTLAFVCGGLWLARPRGQFGGRGLALLAGAGALLAIGSASLVWADAPAPRIARPPVADSRVIIEVVDKGDVVKLTINRAQLANLMAQPVPPIGVAPAIPPVPPPAPAPLQPPVPGKGISIPAPPPIPAPQTPKPLERE